jgi:hypothetical protein
MVELKPPRPYLTSRAEHKAALPGCQKPPSRRLTSQWGCAMLRFEMQATETMAMLFFFAP